MPFEYYNPHHNRIGCHLGPNFGEIKVEPGQYVPTPEQEAKGITPELFGKHAAPSFLHKTPGPVRRQLRVNHQARETERAAAKASVEAEDALIESGAAGVATSSEKGGTVSAQPVKLRVPIPPTGGPRRPELPAGSTNKAANALQTYIDRKTSSGAGKHDNS